MKVYVPALLREVARHASRILFSLMSTYPKSPKEMTRGMMYFPRMLDKIRRLDYVELRERVLHGGTDEEILEWCFEKGRRLNEGDIMVWNGFSSKLGWNDFATPMLERQKRKH